MEKIINKKCNKCGNTENLFSYHNKRLNRLIIHSICKDCKFLIHRQIGLRNKNRIFSEETKQKMSNSHKGIPSVKRFGELNPFYGKKHSKESLEKITKAAKKSKNLGDKSRKNKNYIEIYGKEKSLEIKNKIRDSSIKYLLKKRNIPYPCIGSRETKILNFLECKLGISLIRQYKVLGYFVDGYDIKNNMVYEVYENFHKNKKKKIL